MIAFPWYGGKYRHLAWLLPLLPDCHHYCEPFGGSAAVLLNRRPAPVETYNDLDGCVTNFFRVLRNQPDQLMDLLSLTPYARSEFLDAIKNPECLSDLERARLFYVRARQVRDGISTKASWGNWAFQKHTTRGGISKSVNAWLSSIQALKEIAERMLIVQIENDTAINTIRRYDTPETLFYCDPPYPPESRVSKNKYSHEMTTRDHYELAVALHRVSGMVALSSYQCETIEECYSDWHIIRGPWRELNQSKEAWRQEILITNYPVIRRDNGAGLGQMTLDDIGAQQKTHV